MLEVSFFLPEKQLLFVCVNVFKEEKFVSGYLLGLLQLPFRSLIILAVFEDIVDI